MRVQLLWSFDSAEKVTLVTAGGQSFLLAALVLVTTWVIAGRQPDPLDTRYETYVIYLNGGFL